MHVENEQVVGLQSPHKVDLNAQQKPLLVGQVVTKQDTKLAPRYDKSFNVMNIEQLLLWLVLEFM